MNMESDSLIKIYTDGACSGNPGPGGWGAVIFDENLYTLPINYCCCPQHNTHFLSFYYNIITLLFTIKIQ